MSAFGNYNYNPKTKIDFTQLNIVTVITNFAKDSKFVPVLFRNVNPDASEETVRIDKVKYIKELDNRIVFCCLVNNGKRQQEIMLTFYVMECVWVLKI